MNRIMIVVVATMLSVLIQHHANAGVTTNDEVTITNEITGLACVLKTDTNAITLGANMTVLVGAKTSRIQDLYLSFKPTGKPDNLSDDLPRFRKIRLSPGKSEWITVEFSPKKTGQYTFYAELSSASPTAAVLPFQAISKPITITVTDKPQP